MGTNKRKEDWVDLHIHSNRSDGTISPANIVNLGIENGLACISITDHDTVEGSREAISFIKNNRIHNIDLISGIEISTDYKNGTFHILGYNLDINHPLLLKRLSELRVTRNKRNENIIEKLAKLGIEIRESYDKGLDNCNVSPGRPHIARILMEKGIVNSIDQAFQQYLSKGKKAYVSKKLLSPEESIALIHSAGGKALIAHPSTLKLEGNTFGKFLNRMIDYGLDGLEVYAPIHSPQQIKKFRQAAIKRKLLISAGSDFHGTVKPNVRLGICANGKRVHSSQISNELFSRVLAPN